MLAELSHAIEARDRFTRGHSQRVTALAIGVALRLGWAEDRLAALRLGGALHDVGKVAVPERILRKPGALTATELAQIRAHPSVGARLIQPFASVRPALPCVLYHHERWDGDGYPHGHRGSEIPVEARLLAIADAFDAMASDRPYRAALPVEDALAELDRCSGSQFDPELTSAFLDVWRHRRLAAAS